MTEDQIQAKVFQYFHNNYPETRKLLFHVPNGGLRNLREASKFKSMGVIAGVPDLLLINKGKLYGIELKTEDGVLSKVQKELHKVWELNGIEVLVTYGLKESIDEITKIIK